MSDPSHWWPGPRREGDGNPPPRQDSPGNAPPGSGPYGRGGGYYYPPGTTPGPRSMGGPPPAPPTRRRAYSPRTAIWALIGLGVALLLARAHSINRTEVVLFCVLIPSIILHEVAHGWVALIFGDDTAKRMGRLTLNPLAHIDVVGTIIVPLLMIWGGYGFFGWAKPVPVNVAKLRSPRNHGVLVSLAGPAVNVVLCVISAVLFHLFGGVRIANGFEAPPLWVLILIYLGLVNVWLTVFNMIPIPPLDGSVLLERLLPGRWWPHYLNLRRYTLPLVLIVVVLASIIPDGHTSLIGHFAISTQNWWLRVLGVRVY
ncbi:MAG: site-2 protease family protein [Acidimicrobiales bacterium]